MHRIHVFSSTKAQYIKTAPLLRLLAARGVEHRLIDSGQHGSLGPRFRDELGIREPDVTFGTGQDVDSLTDAVRWAATTGLRLRSVDRLRDEVFGGSGGICVVHGDTASTWLATTMARRAGLRVAHVEAGLRSFNPLHPFPEELIRTSVMRRADLLFAPDAAATANLRRMRRVRGRIVTTSGNTIIDALRHSLGDSRPTPSSGPVVLTTHRFENIRSARRLRAFVALARHIATSNRTLFVIHGATRVALERLGLEDELAGSGVQTRDLMDHRAFTAALCAAPFVVTDGGSVQEETAAMGIPCLLWRRRTERPDGVGSNVVVSNHDPAIVRDFLADPQVHRGPGTPLDAEPSREILDVLLEELAAERT